MSKCVEPNLSRAEQEAQTAMQDDKLKILALQRKIGKDGTVRMVASLRGWSDAKKNAH